MSRFVIRQIGNNGLFSFLAVLYSQSFFLNNCLWFEYRPWHLHGIGNIRNGESLTSSEFIWKSNLGVGRLLLMLLSISLWVLLEWKRTNQLFLSVVPFKMAYGALQNLPNADTTPILDHDQMDHVKMGGDHKSGQPKRSIDLTESPALIQLWWSSSSSASSHLGIS